MNLVISDANIFIDLEIGGIIQYLFQLTNKYRFATPDILFQEELTRKHAYLKDAGLIIMPLDEYAIELAIRLREKYPSNISQNDIFALALAKQEDSLLLTGDKALKKAAKEESIKVHGIIWLIEQFCYADLVSFSDIENAYKRMRDAQRRLPWEIVKESLKRIHLHIEFCKQKSLPVL